MKYEESKRRKKYNIFLDSFNRNKINKFGDNNFRFVKIKFLSVSQSSTCEPIILKAK